MEVKSVSFFLYYNLIHSFVVISQTLEAEGIDVHVYVFNSHNSVNKCANVRMAGSTVQAIPCVRMTLGQRVQVVMRDLNTIMAIYELHVIGH